MNEPSWKTAHANYYTQTKGEQSRRTSNLSKERTNKIMRSIVLEEVFVEWAFQLNWAAERETKCFGELWTEWDARRLLQRTENWANDNEHKLMTAERQTIKSSDLVSASSVPLFSFFVLLTQCAMGRGYWRNN